MQSRDFSKYLLKKNSHTQTFSDQKTGATFNDNWYLPGLISKALLGTNILN